METITQLFLVFIMYAIVGYIIETIDIYIEHKKFSLQRGYLSGPIIPIFGLGAILIAIFLSEYQNNILVLFGLSVLVCGTLEFFVSYFMEKFFNIRWWDYSNSKYNLDGRIELKNCLLFGVSGVLIVKVLQPFFTSIVNTIPNKISYIIAIILFVLLIIDFIISTVAAYELKKKVVPLLNEDNTEAHNEEIIKIINHASKRMKNVIQSFPHIHLQVLNRSKKNNSNQKV